MSIKMTQTIIALRTITKIGSNRRLITPNSSQIKIGEVTVITMAELARSGINRFIAGSTIVCSRGTTILVMATTVADPD